MNTLTKKYGALRKNNKGFTLVELIIVIAIIAVLAAVLAPQYIAYVERSRVAVDENTIQEIIHATEVAIADPTVNEGITANTSVVVANGAAVTSGNSGLQTAVQEVITGTTSFKSNRHKATAADTYTIVVTYATGGITVAPYAPANWG